MTRLLVISMMIIVCAVRFESGKKYLLDFLRPSIGVKSKRVAQARSVPNAFLMVI